MGHLHSGLIALGMLVFYALVLGLSRWFPRRVESEVSFFLADRTLGQGLAALTFVASWFGAASTIGSLDAFHRQGLSGAWLIVIPSVLSGLVMIGLLAKRVAAQRALSQPEAVERAYGPPGRACLALIIALSSVNFMAAQIVAAGQIFHQVLDVPISGAMLAVTLIVLGYSLWGGFKAVVLTDTLQVVLIALALLILAGASLGQWILNPSVAERLASLPPAFWQWGQDWPHHLAITFTFVLGWSIAPEAWQRLGALADPARARKTVGLAFGVLLGFYGLVMAIGLISAGWLSVPSEGPVLLALAERLPAIWGALVVIGVLATISSTMDSPLSSGSLALTHDLYGRFIHPSASASARVVAARGLSVAMACLALAIALYYQDIIRILWISADLYASSMVVPIAGLLFLRRVPRLAGLLAMGLGGVSVGFSAMVAYGWVHPPFPWPGWPYSTLIGVLMSMLGFALGYWQPIVPEPPGATAPQTRRPGVRVV